MDLRVEYLVEPIGLGVRKPRLSWGSAGDVEIEVWKADGTRVWRASTGEAWIEYGGERLESDTAYRWRVGSQFSSFTTGLLDASDWRAAWVRPVQEPAFVERWTLTDWITGQRPELPVTSRLRPVQLLRQRFSVEGSVVRGRLYASAHGIYQAWVNGVEAGDQVLAPGFDSYQDRVSVQCYDVTSSLRGGANVLAFALADGWFAGRIGVTGSSAQFGDSVSAIWQLHLEYSDGSTGVVCSGGDVAGSVGGWVYADLFVGECYDSRAEPSGWKSHDFSDAGWAPVGLSGEGTAALRPFSGEPIRRLGEIPPRAVTGDAESGWVADFGQVVAGRVRISAVMAAGQTVTLEHTETLDGDGNWYTNIAGINKEQTDTYIASGLAEGESWEPAFTFHGFRYVRIKGVDSPPDATAIVLGSDLAWTGEFRCDDARLNRLHENVVWSQKANFLSIPTDCPQRERAGWTGDILVFAPAATNNAQVVPFLRRWLDNVRADQLADGRVPIYSPYSPWDAEAATLGTGIGAVVASAGWGDAIVHVPWALYERTADHRVLAENFDAMLAWIAYQRTPEYSESLHFGDWLTPSTIEGRPLHEAIGVAPALTGPLIAPMFRAQSLTLAARAARVLGRPEAAELESEAGRVRAEFAASSVSEDGRLPVELQGLYVLALAFDLIPARARSAAAARLAELVESRGGRLDTGFLSVPHLLDVLWDTGRRDLARRVLWQSEAPSWLYQVDNGATSIWESWDAVGPDGPRRELSLNHYAFGCVDDWLYRRVAGIRAAAPGYREVVFEPDFEAGAGEVRAHVGTPFGRVGVGWRRRDGEVRVWGTVPEGVVARLVLPGGEISLPAGEFDHRRRYP
ncbi:family 78 glycoside hydrolase catalytic domain [Actinoplanes sp. NPDC051861]|uniref:family 78 glycoside hydrolase catalytic domain n=1 Tax=Actinoplanes sp. NPDC051861 TaxID=3155170 RepID=UPI003417358A